MRIGFKFTSKSPEKCSVNRVNGKFAFFRERTFSRRRVFSDHFALSASRPSPRFARQSRAFPLTSGRNTRKPPPHPFPPPSIPTLPSRLDNKAAPAKPFPLSHPSNLHSPSHPALAFFCACPSCTQPRLNTPPLRRDKIFVFGFFWGRRHNGNQHVSSKVHFTVLSEVGTVDTIFYRAPMHFAKLFAMSFRMGSFHCFAKAFHWVRAAFCSDLSL